jgi:uncharacterized protein (DUF885 family)
MVIAGQETTKRNGARRVARPDHHHFRLGHTMYKPLLSLLALLTIPSLAVAQAPTAKPAEKPIQDAVLKLHTLFGEAWEQDMQASPMFATQVGDNRFNHRLARISEAEQLVRLKQREQILARAKAIPREELLRQDQINREIFIQLLENEINELNSESYLIPITNREGFHISFPELAKQVPLKTVADYENYVARLNDFGRYADEHIALMREGIKRGFTLPSVVLEGYDETIRPHIVERPEDSLLFSAFTTFPKSMAQSQQKRLTAKGRKAIQDQVSPAYQRFLDFMVGEYIPSARGSIGASALPNGRQFYRSRVKKYTTLDVTPEQVHQTGLREVARIKTEMLAIIKKVGFDGDFHAFVKHLRSSPKFYAKTPEQLKKEIAYVLKRMDGELPRLFKTLPRTPYGIREVPSYIAPKTTAAYYSIPAGDGSQAGFYYINTFNLKSRPLYQIEALSLHEAVPGHHLQLALQQELGELPMFRRFAGFTVFVEGWALYSERLGLEVGFYTDPYSDFGRLSYEMWRACRLVVDPGMHYLGWSRQQAIAFMADNTALSEHNIVAEVDRYIAWPGQALAYKTGEMRIRQLRTKAERQLGAAFDIREFHDAVLLSGSVPLSVLEENIDAFIERVAAEQTPDAGKTGSDN